MTIETVGEAHDALLKHLKSCWMQGCTDLGAMVGQPIKFRSEGVARLAAESLAEQLPPGGLCAPLCLGPASGVDLEAVFSPRLSLVLAGVLNVQRPEEIATRIAAGSLEASDLAAVGELANILASAFEEPMSAALGQTLQITRGDIQTVEERAGGRQVADGAGFLVQRLTLAVAGMGEGEIFLVLPVDLAARMAGEALDGAPDIAPDSDGAQAPGETPARVAPARRPAMGRGFPAGDATTPRVLVAGPVAQDTADVEQVFVLEGAEVVVCPRLRDIGTTFDPGDFTLVVLTTPPGSLAALPYIRDLVALPQGPAVVVATRRATPSLVFQSARAGADYVVVLPPSDSAAARLAELGRQPRRAAAA